VECEEGAAEGAGGEEICQRLWLGGAQHLADIWGVSGGGSVFGGVFCASCFPAWTKEEYLF